MIILGVDPGSLKMGWALINLVGKRIDYLDSGVLVFDQKLEFLERTLEIKKKVQDLVKKNNPDEVSLESLIYVKSPTALIKLAQARGIVISELVEVCPGKIFEYSPNLVKMSTVGHGHASKESVQKFLDMTLGKREYKTHDESDALAIAICHALNRHAPTLKRSRKSSTLKNSLSHKVGNL